MAGAVAAFGLILTAEVAGQGLASPLLERCPLGWAPLRGHQEEAWLVFEVMATELTL